MKTQEIRTKFLDYFKKHGHTIVPSSPVVPHQDPSLLFANAGMNQFKDIFLGKARADYTRASTAQKCIRSTDLDNVGHTSRHCTFFEMLGNFSFGDYFKEQAIDFAWEVSTQIFGFDKTKIWPSVFKDDDEAFKLWTRYIPAARITRFGEKENFWAMGEAGPCGPCSELLYDRGKNFGNGDNPTQDTSGERFLEFWNLVFMQYNRFPGGTMEPLPKPSIDTGAGIERVMSLINGVENVFETDILRDLIAAVEKESKVTYSPHDGRKAAAFRVIADHLRSLSFAIADGAQPSNVERGYVLRKILRRAVRYGRMLGFEEPFLARLLPALCNLMGQHYPEIVVGQERIAQILTREEEAFFKTLRRGGNLLGQIIEASKASKVGISGVDAFKLKDTYGLPFEEITLLAKDNGLEVDVQGFEKLEEEARQKSKQAQKAVHQVAEESLYTDFIQKQGACTFIRQEAAEKEFLESKVTGIIVEGQFVEKLNAGQEGAIILKETQFYPEMGGQVGDSGLLANEKAYFEVSDTKSPFKGVIIHSGKLSKGQIAIGDKLKGSVDWDRRKKIESNHTATHLLHWALHKVLGEHARQAGSVVDPDRLRFDFAHFQQLSPLEIRSIEALVNEKIRQNLPVATYELPYDEAQKRADIKQFFGEKYGTSVRVVDIEFSKELCGGTHTQKTGDIGYFRIAREMSIAAGVRRIEALTGKAAEDFSYFAEDLLNQISEKLKTPQHKLVERIEKLNEEMKEVQAELKEAKKIKLAQMASKIEQKNSKKKTPFVIAEVDLPSSDLKDLADAILSRFPSCVVAAGCLDGEKASLMIKVSPDLVQKGIKASDLIKPMLAKIEGNGGGKADFAQGAGKRKEQLKEALIFLEELI